MATKPKATIEDLYGVDGKAELVDGELLIMEPTGSFPNRAAGTIYVKLRDYEERTGRGLAYTDNAAFIVNLPRRKSFSPDAAFYTGSPSGMKFLEGAPVFAVEVRSEGDYGPAAEKKMAAKRADYFAAGSAELCASTFGWNARAAAIATTARKRKHGEPTGWI